jgi:uncharacterized protein YlxW (UPF0749 family)
MNPFVSLKNENWLLPVSAMCLVLGFMISLAWVTESNRSSRLGLLGADQRSRISAASVDIEKFQELSQQVAKLQEDNTRLQNALANQSGQAKVLNDSLQDIKRFAGLTELEGPGIMVTLRDKPGTQSIGLTGPDSIIHDVDVLRVVNELFASGAEAISVNDIRIAAGSTFRCVGPTILINDIRIASPVVIRAVGNLETLYGGMNLPGGVLAEVRETDPAMVKVDKVKSMRLPAYVGSTTTQVGKVPKVTK